MTCRGSNGALTVPGFRAARDEGYAGASSPARSLRNNPSSGQGRGLRRRLEPREELAQQAFERLELLRIEPIHQRAIADGVRFDGGIDDLEPGVGQLDDHTTASVRVGEPEHESATLKPVEPAGHSG